VHQVGFYYLDVSRCTSTKHKFYCELLAYLIEHVIQNVLNMLHASSCSLHLCSSIIYLFFILYNEPTNAQLIHKLSHSPYMFRHYCVILREFVVSTLPSYTSMSNELVGNIIQNLKFKIISHLFYAVEMFKIFKILKLSYL
jgi:hypothetical protein